MGLWPSGGPGVVPLGQHRGEDGWVDVAAGQHRHRSTGGRQIPPVQARGDGRRAAWFGNQVGPGRGAPHRAAYLVLGHRDHVVHEAEDVLKRQYADLFHPQRVGDGPLGVGGGPGNPFALPERVACVRRKFRFDTDHPYLRAHRPDGRGDPGDQAAAADGDGYQIHAGALLGDLEPDGALTGDHIPVIERRDERVPVPADEVLGGRDPGRQRGLAGHDLRPEAPGGAELCLGRVVGDDHRGRDAEQGCRVRDGLCVVAAGVGHHSLPAHLFGQRTDRRVGPAQLEGTDRLEAFRLDQQGRLDAGKRHQRGRDDGPVQTRRSGLDLLDRDQPGHSGTPETLRPPWRSPAPPSPHRP